MLIFMKILEEGPFDVLLNNVGQSKFFKVQELIMQWQQMLNCQRHLLLSFANSVENSIQRYQHKSRKDMLRNEQLFEHLCSTF